MFNNFLVFAWQTNKFHGWKGNKNVLYFNKNCKESTDYDRVVDCINSGTFKHDDIIEKYTNGRFNNETDVTKNIIYTEEFANFLEGKSHSMNISFSDLDGDEFKIYFKPGHNCSIFIHDPHFLCSKQTQKQFHTFFSIWRISNAKIFSLQQSNTR
jgi:hypothetical protein